MPEPSPIALRLLVQIYRDVSRRGRYAGGEQERLAQACSDALRDLPPYRRIVAFALCEFFSTGSKKFDQTATGTASWAKLDMAILEAVNFVANDGDASDAVRIADSVNMLRLEWFGE